MSIALAMNEPAFDLIIKGWDRTLNGARTDEKIFEHAGLIFDTNIGPGRFTMATTITLKVLQDKLVLLEHFCDYIHVSSVGDEEIRISWSIGAMGKTYGNFSIVPGWKLGGSTEHVPDVNF